MMKKKLGLAIQVISSGAQPPVVWNGDGAWENEVRDVRTYASLLVAPLSSNEVLPFLTIGREGCFITLLKTLTGRGGDCSTAWLYIPRTIAIPDDEVLAAYRLVKEHITQGGNDAEIEKFFDKEYEEETVPPTYAPSQGNSVAVRYYTGDDELRALLGKYRYQKYYSQYEAVFLLDKDSAMKANQSVKDISSEALKEIVVVNPPTPEDLEKMGKGTQVFIKQKKFVKPRAVEEGTSLTLRFTRPGFEELTEEITVRGKGTLPLPTKPWQRKISKKMFTVRDNKKKTVENAVIFVNGANITQQEQYLTEDECKAATVQIDKTSDYEAYEGQHNLLSDNVHITLTRRIQIYTCLIELKNREIGQLTITSDMMPEGCPLEAYKEDQNERGEHVLQLGLWYELKHYLIGFAAAIALGVCVIAYNAISNWWDGHTITWGFPPRIEERGHTKINPPVPPQETPPAEEKGDDNTAEVRNDDENAIAYLNHTLWARDSLEKYALTKGLYDELNHYRFANIRQRTGKIEESSIFLEIKDLAKEMVEKDITMSGPDSGDGTITPSEWKKAVKAKLTQ